MKVFHIITQMEAGGAQGAAVRNARYFREQGIESEVIFLYTKRAVYQGEGIISLADKAPSGVAGLCSILYKLYRLLRAEPGARVICYTHYANVIGALVAFLAGIRNIVVSHRNPVSTYPTICRYVDYLLGLTPIYTKCICVSNTVVNSFSAYPFTYKNKIELVYNGIDTQQMQKHAASEQFDWIRQNAAGQMILLSTGRLHPQKNQLVLIKALQDVKNAKLFIAGEGELRPMFEREIQQRSLQDRVMLIGEIPPQSVAEFLLAGDVFLFPSNYEAFGFSVVEAMAAGLPVLCSDIAAMREIVGDAGILLDKDDEKLWADRLNRLDDAALSRMAVLSKQRAALFSLEQMAKRYLTLVSH